MDYYFDYFSKVLFELDIFLDEYDLLWEVEVRLE